MSRLDRLSTEILEIILQPLHPLHIAQCRAVSSRFMHLIDSSVKLQYKIELHVAGMLDALPESPLSIQQRLDLLKSGQKLFNEDKPLLRWNKVKDFRLKTSETFSLGHTEHYVLRACAFGHDAPQQLHPTHCGVMDLHSIDPPSDETRWKCEDLATAVEDECFDVSVSQNLLVMRQKTPEAIYKLSFLDLFTGEPHSRASTNPLEIWQPERPESPTPRRIETGSIDVMGDVLVISYGIGPGGDEGHTQQDHDCDVVILVVYHWPSGQTLKTFVHPEPNIVSISPISTTHFLIGSQSTNEEGTTAFIDLYSVVPTEDLPLIQQTARFSLPEFRKGWDVDKWDCSLDIQVSQTPQILGKRTHPSRPFIADPEASVISCSFGYSQVRHPPHPLPDGALLPFAEETLEYRIVNFITPASTFLRYRDSKAFKIYPWLEWGPQNTRWFYGDVPENRNDACGYRVLSKKGDVILDFNQVEIKRELCRSPQKKIEDCCSDGTCTGDVDLVGTGTTVFTNTHVSTIPKEMSIFSGMVTGCLPFRRIPVQGLKEESVFWAPDKIINVKQESEETIIVSLFEPSKP